MENILIKLSRGEDVSVQEFLTDFPVGLNMRIQIKDCNNKRLLTSGTVATIFRSSYINSTISSYILSYEKDKVTVKIYIGERGISL